MGADTPSDAVVLRRSHLEPQEFEVVFDRHALRVLRYLQLRVGYALAEELMAETFVRALNLGSASISAGHQRSRGCPGSRRT